MTKKLSYRFAISLLVSFGVLADSNPSFAGTLEDVEFCGTAIGISQSSAGLAQYSDKQIENGVCMTISKATDLVAKKANDIAINACTEAAKVMYVEFKHRFPHRDASEVLGHC